MFEHNEDDIPIDAHTQGESVEKKINNSPIVKTDAACDFNLLNMFGLLKEIKNTLASLQKDMNALRTDLRGQMQTVKDKVRNNLFVFENIFKQYLMKVHETYMKLQFYELIRVPFEPFDNNQPSKPIQPFDPNQPSSSK